MALSDMMKHYLSVKDKYKDCIVFYRLGDFYEMFFDDAVKASEVLGLTLTGRDCGLESRAPMCGVPFHAADTYIAQLVSQGFKVAICEQLEEASSAKKLVRRDVVKVVTAGTITDDDALDEKQNNYICCACKNNQTVGLAWADITTGELCATQFAGENCIEKCIAQMVKLQVKEVVVNDEMLLAAREVPEVSRGILPHFSSYPEWAFGYSAAEKQLLEQFKTGTLSSYSIYGNNEAISATGALIEYLKETQMHALKNIDSVTFNVDSDYLQLDVTAVRNLELIKSNSGNGKYGSLLWVMDKTCTPMGARRLLNAILYPLFDSEKINYRLDGVQELFDSTVVRLCVRDLLKGVKDIERISGKVSNNTILPKDCLQLAASLSVIPNLKFNLSGFNSKIINDICNGFVDMSDVVDLIDRAIADQNELPATMKDGGYIKSGFDARLDELRNIKLKGKNVLFEIEARERDRTGIRNLKINYNRIFGYYIEVSKSNVDKVPIDYKRRQTVANAERFYTDELKQLEEKLLSSEELAQKLEIEIYDKIKQILLEKIELFKRISENIALLDMVVSFAEVSKTNKYVRPLIVDSNCPLEVKDGRHPVVEVISKERFISNDVLLDEEQNRTMIITGPNMAGKSTYMRQVAIIAIMAHIGCFVPAKSAKIPLIDRVFTRVGASDNLIFDQSTFMVEMIEVATIIRNATKNSLLILDEVGRGTSTYDGLSIAWAVIEYLTQNIGAKTMFATHYHELTELESKYDGIKNYKISVKEINDKIVFLRKIMRGGANRSFGIEVAALAGIPSVVTDKAKKILKRIENGDKFELSEAGNADETEEKSNLSEVETILSEVDLNNLSPMQAFLLVSDLVEKVKR